MTEDPRKAALKSGLRQLNSSQLRRLLVHVNLGGEVLLDRDEHGHANYSSGVYCPLAIAVGMDEWPERTDEQVANCLRTVFGLTIYNTRGIEGEFYTTERRRDLVIAANEVLVQTCERERQTLSFAYGNLALSTNHQPSRSAFAQLVAERYGWTQEEFNAWADRLEWSKP